MSDTASVNRSDVRERADLAAAVSDTDAARHWLVAVIAPISIDGCVFV